MPCHVLEVYHRPRPPPAGAHVRLSRRTDRRAHARAKASRLVIHGGYHAVILHTTNTDTHLPRPPVSSSPMNKGKIIII